MKIKWTDLAKFQVKEIYAYYKLNVSKSVAEKIKNEVVGSVLVLSKYPLAGQKEELLINCKQEFRYLVIGKL